MQDFLMTNVVQRYLLLEGKRKAKSHIQQVCFWFKMNARSVYFY